MPGKPAVKALHVPDPRTVMLTAASALIPHDGSIRPWRYWQAFSVWRMVYGDRPSTGVPHNGERSQCGARTTGIEPAVSSSGGRRSVP